MGKRTSFIDGLGITENQKAWAHAYVTDGNFNASAAARSVGLDESTGREYRTKPNVMAYVDKIQHEELARMGLSKQRVVAEIAAIALSNIADIVRIEDGRLVVSDFSDLPRHQTAAIRKVKLRRSNRGEGDFDEVLELELHDKTKALDQLRQVLGLNGHGEEDPDEERRMFTGLTIIGNGAIVGDGPDMGPSQKERNEDEEQEDND